MNALESQVNNSNIDIFCINEHWLSEQEYSYYNFSGYVRADIFCRKNMEGGGVAIFIKPYFDFKVLNFISNASIEQHCELAGILLKEHRIIVIALYRSPIGDFTIFLETVQMVVQMCYINYKNCKIILAGDYNIDFKIRDNIYVRLFDAVSELNLNITHYETTRYTYMGRGTCLDNILTNVDESIYEVIVVNSGLSDHLGVQFKIALENCKYSIKDFHRRMFSTANYECFNNHLLSFQWNEILKDRGTNDMFNLFLDIFIRGFNTYFPLKKVKRQNVGNIKWYSSELKKMRDNIIFLSNLKLPQVRPILKSYKIQYKTALKNAKVAAYSKFIDNSNNKSKAMWNIIQQECGGNKTVCKAENVSPDTFNNFFATVAEDTIFKLPPATADYISLLKNKKINYQHSLYLRPTDETEIDTIIRGLNNAKSSDIYGINVELLKRTSFAIVEPLSLIINSCFQSGIYPDKLKTSKITPIFKKGDAADPNNYRPIAITPAFSKIFETAIKTRMLGFLEKYKVFSDNQFGFRENRSTTKAAIKLLDKVFDSIEKGLHVLGTFCDLCKAFDCVSPNIISDKLHYYGIRGEARKLIFNFLTNREQFVFYNNELSSVKSVNIGVGQGTILGPLIFLLYINDLPDNMSAMTMLYADDSSFINDGVHCEEVFVSANETQEHALNWFTSNKLSLNTEKTKTVVFSLNRQLCNNLLYNNNTVKFLGFHLDSRLSWKEHIHSLATKLNKITYMFRRMTNCISDEMLIMIYYSHFQSLLSYGIELWGSSTDWMRIFILQKKVVRIISRAKPQTHCRPLFKQLGILTTASLYILNILLYITDNSCHLNKNEDFHNHDTRQKNMFRTPMYRYSSSRNLPSVVGIELYNLLPPEVKLLSRKIFKQKLRSFLSDRAFYNVEEFRACAKEMV